MRLLRRKEGSMITRRRYMGKKRILPQGYTQLKWIENTTSGNSFGAYISTGVNAVNLGRMVSIMQYPTSTNINVGDGCIQGSTAWLMLGLVESYFGVQCGAGTTEKKLKSWDTNWHTIEVNANSGVGMVDNLSVVLSILRPNAVITLFTRENPTIRKHPSRRSLVMIYDINMQLVRHFIPCINPNNVVGMYDIVGGQFYSSPNGVAFVAGPVV